MILLGIIIGIVFGFIAKVISDKLSKKVENDWEIYDAVSGKWNIVDSNNKPLIDKYAWYEIYYSPSKDYYKLEIGGYSPNEHKLYHDVVKTLRENNEKARGRKQQKQHIVDIMEADEKDGLYDQNK